MADGTASLSPARVPGQPAVEGNARIAAAFTQMAELLALHDANPFRVRAYRHAARVVGALRVDLVGHAASGAPLPRLPGLGAEQTARIEEFARTGRLAALDRLRGDLPSGLGELLQLPGIGPKRARQLHEALQVDSLPALLQAARDGRIRRVPGFGERRIERIAQSLERHLARARRLPRAQVLPWAERLVAFVLESPSVLQACAAGSLRRGAETVGELLLLAAVADGAPVCRRFATHPEVREVLQLGDTRAAVLLRDGLQVQLRTVAPAGWGAALVHATGSPAHENRLRQRADARGLTLDEYGLHHGRRALGAATEEAVYAALGLPWIPPELREDRGEIEAAEHGGLPALVQPAELRGDLHVRSDWGDGEADIAAMAEAARARGLQYLAVCDHLRRQGLPQGLDAARLGEQVRAIARLNDRLHGIELLAGAEVEILGDGQLGAPDAALVPLDLVVASVHTGLDLPRARQTERVLAALDYPLLRMLAHPGGRLIDQRAPMDLDMLAVVRKCRARGVALELNARPERLDLTDLHCRMARDEGVPVAVCADARSPQEFDHLVHGIAQARRGWLAGADVLNTRSLHELRRWLHRLG